MRLAASYARKSTHDDLGIADQHATNTEAARRDGFTIPDDPVFRFADDAVSGTTTRRAGLDRLRRLVGEGAVQFQRVYIKDRTRLGRFDDPRYHAFLEVTFEEAKVPITYVNSIAGPPSSDPGQRLLHSVTGALEASIATEERRKLIERTTDGTRGRAVSGWYPGTTSPYALARWLVDASTGADVEQVEPGRPVRRTGCAYKLHLGPSEEQEIVRRIFRDVRNDVPLRAIARALNADGMAAPKSGPRACEEWRAGTVRRIATNPLYKGVLVWGRTKRSEDPLPGTTPSPREVERITYPNFVEPIVPEDLWEEAQDKLRPRGARARRRGQEPRFLLSGLLRCASCNGGFFGFISTKKYPTRRSYYRHSARTNALAPHSADCAGKDRYFQSDTIDNVVLEVLNSLANDPVLQEAARDAFARDRAAALGPSVKRKLDRHRARCVEIKGKMARMVSAGLEDPTLSAAAVFQEVQATHQASLDSHEAAIRTLESEQQLWEAAQAAIPTGRALITAALEEATFREKRELVKSVVEQVRLAPDRSVVEVELSPLV